MRQERKKRIVNHMLCETVRQVDDRQVALVSEKSFWQKLMHTAPEAFQFQEQDTKTPFHLVRDKNINFPAFERHLFCFLDYDLVILIICLINLIDMKLNNPMLAICISYFVERFLRWLRAFIGEKNLV